MIEIKLLILFLVSFTLMMACHERYTYWRRQALWEELLDFVRVTLPSKILASLIVAYLWIKALIYPQFSFFDRDLARVIHEDFKERDWIEMISNCKSTFLPEARADWWYDFKSLIKEKVRWLFKRS